MSEFKAGRSPILIATDVASRGLGTWFIFISGGVCGDYFDKHCNHPERNTLLCSQSFGDDDFGSAVAL